MKEVCYFKSYFEASTKSVLYGTFVLSLRYNFLWSFPCSTDENEAILLRSYLHGWFVNLVTKNSIDDWVKNSPNFHRVTQFLWSSSLYLSFCTLKGGPSVCFAEAIGETPGFLKFFSIVSRNYILEKIFLMQRQPSAEHYVTMGRLDVFYPC